MRRVYLPQYSGAPSHGNAGELWGMAVPFLHGGRVVYQADEDTAERYGPHPHD
jgi:hypothetical protein